MTHYRQVNAVDLNHPRRSCGVDDPIRFDGPNAAPMQLAENLDILACLASGLMSRPPRLPRLKSLPPKFKITSLVPSGTELSRRASIPPVVSPLIPAFTTWVFRPLACSMPPRIAGHASEGVLLAPRATICAAAGLAEAALKTTNNKTNRHFLIALTAFPLRLTLFHAHSQPSVQARLWPPCET
jgi:hypothetical protein